MPRREWDWLHDVPRGTWIKYGTKNEVWTLAELITEAAVWQQGTDDPDEYGTVCRRGMEQA